VRRLVLTKEGKTSVFLQHQELTEEKRFEMSMTVWFNVRHGMKYKTDEEDHSATFANVEALDLLSQQLGILPTSTFFDETDVRYNFGDLPESDEGWCPARTVRTGFRLSSAPILRFLGVDEPPQQLIFR